jgi:phytoene dehydrogenase-like protein
MTLIDTVDAASPRGGEARKDTYDVVVIGAGMGGLTAGALLAHAGVRTLVVEADDKPGGYTHALCRDGYTFDRADNLITSCQPDGPFGQGVIDAVLSELGVRDQCEFVRVGDPFYESVTPESNWPSPAAAKRSWRPTCAASRAKNAGSGGCPNCARRSTVRWSRRRCGGGPWTWPECRCGRRPCSATATPR